MPVPNPSTVSPETLAAWSKTASRGELLQFLATADRNGVYLDRDSEREGYPPCSREDAIAIIERMIREDMTPGC